MVCNVHSVQVHGTWVLRGARVFKVGRLCLPQPDGRQDVGARALVCYLGTIETRNGVESEGG